MRNQSVRERLQLRPKLWVLYLAMFSVLIASTEAVNSINQQELVRSQQQNFNDQKDMADQGDVERSSQLQRANSNHRQQSTTNEYVINSLDDDSFGKFTGNRLTYEQAATIPSSTTTTTTSTSTMPPATVTEDFDRPVENANSAQSMPSTSFKPEPRNHLDDEHQQRQQDPAIIDHRPVSSSSVAFTVDQQVVSDATTRSPTIATSSTPPPALQQQQQSASQMTWASAQPSASTGGAMPQSNTVQGYNIQPQQQSSLAQGSLISPSSQIMTVQQHPTSINSIISDQQQQQIQTSSNHVLQAQQLPGQVITMQATGAGQATLPIMYMSNPLGGRRFSNWLRGISSMLANIFNRREHGSALIGGQTTGNGHWIQFSPNTPNWITQAQSAMQQLQQQPSFATVNNNQPLIGAAGTNRYTFVPAASSQQQQNSMTISLQPTTASTMLQQQPATTTSTQLATGGDLQASSSSLSHATVVAAPQLVVQTGQAQLQLGQQSHPQVGQMVTNQAQQQTPSGSRQLGLVQTQSLPDNSQAQRQSAIPASNQLSQPKSNTNARYGRSLAQSVAASQNLPLIHYSRYSD